MMAAEGAIVPVLPTDGRHRRGLRSRRLPARRRRLLRDPEGNMLSMPFNSSTADHVLQQGRVRGCRAFDPEQPPETWAQVEEFSAPDHGCGRGRNAASPPAGSAGRSWKTSRPGTTSHRHAAERLRRLETELTVNGDVQVRHWDNLASWQEDGVFRIWRSGRWRRWRRRPSTQANARCT